MRKGEVLSFGGRTYTVLERLGSGANAAAYLAECDSGELVTKCILKEYAPQKEDDYEAGKERFMASGRTQNRIRQLAELNNQTPPVSHVFEANGTAYIDVACFGGNTLDRLELTLPQYMAVCETVAKTAGFYHRAGFVCLDLKPENIFVLQNAPADGEGGAADTVTQLVEFIDFDSVRDISGNAADRVFSCTREWAAPEQLNPYAAGRLGCAADIYTVGEIVFFLLFGRHSAETEHRGFSKYPFDECRREYRRYTERPDIQALFTRLFRNTLRSSAANRFGSMGEVAGLLGKVCAELGREDYVIPVLPAVPQGFVGREEELGTVAGSLAESPALYITGVGGIGKSALVRKYIGLHRTDYDVIAYLEYDGDIRHTFCDDMQLQISTVSRQDGEPQEDYFARKLKALRRICAEKRVLFVVDNFTGRADRDMSRIISCGYDIIIVTRNKPPKNSFPFVEVGAISDRAELLRLISLDLGRQLTKDERACFGEMITLVQGHTLVLELIARQIAAGRLDVRTALGSIRENGFSRFSGERVGNYKDGEEVYDTLAAIISGLFDAGKMSAEAKQALRILSLLNVRGLEKSLLQQFFPDIPEDTLAGLSAEGWIYADSRVRLHPVIAETVRGWAWDADDVTVMELHKKMTDIYVGMANEAHIREILREADIFRSRHDRHIIRGMYFDMLGCLYDVQLAGAYGSDNDRDRELEEKLFECMDFAISEMQLSSDSRSRGYLTQYCLSMASVLLRSGGDEENYAEASELLDIISELIEENEPENSANRCYFCMVKAWYFTLAEPELNETKALVERAEAIAGQVFPTALELIDVIHIPAANCFYYHGEFGLSAAKLEAAAEICRGFPDMLPYIDKRAELLRCLIDVYLAAGNREARCRELLAEIDRINEEYREQGICREVPPEIRGQISI